MNSVISTAISLIGTVVMYSAAIKSGVTYDNYVAFTASYGYISGAFMEISSIALMIAGILSRPRICAACILRCPETIS